MKTMAFRFFAPVVCLLALSLGTGCSSDSSTDPDKDTATQDVLEDSSCESGDAQCGDVQTDTSPQDLEEQDTAEITQPDPVDPTVAAALQATLDEHVVFSAEPGITLAIYTKEGNYWEGAAGLRDIKAGTAMQVDTGFRVGSNTKPFVATLVMMQVEKGLIDLDAPLSDYVQGYEAWNDITVRQLVSMQSGIPDYLTVPELMLAVIPNPTKPVTHEYILDYVKEKPLLYQPGEGANYSNTNYMLLGMILEKVTGVPPDQLLQEQLLEPLGLENTFLDLEGKPQDNVSHGYMDLNLVGMIFGVPPAVLAFIPKDNIVDGTVIDSSYLFHPSLTWTAGALISTAHDMVTFMRALLTGEILSMETVEMMEQTRELMILGDPVQYGLGLQIRPTDFGGAYGHGGLNFGYQAGTYRLLDHGITISHMHNYLPEQSDMFQNDILDILINGVTEVPTVCTPPEGFFEDDGTDTLFVRFKGPVNDPEVPKVIAGIGNFKEMKNSKTVPLYGLGTQAQIKEQATGNRLDVQSLAPGTTKDAEVLVVNVTVDTKWLDAIASPGDVETTAETDSAVFMTLAEIDMVDGTLNPSKLCFKAVRDMTRRARVFVCEADAYDTVDGKVLRTFMKVPVTHDETVVAQTLGSLFLPECLCYKVETQSWGLCQ